MWTSQRLILPVLVLCCWFDRISSREFVVSGYLPDYRIESKAAHLNQTALVLSDLILFSIQTNSIGFLGGCCLQQEHYELARQARAYRNEKKPNEDSLKIWISVGGGGRSQGFNEIVANKQRRTRFLDNLKDLCVEQTIDGVDMDWEAPQTQTEYKQYMNFLVQAADLFHQHNLLLSVALHPNQFLAIPVLYTLMDRIHLMAYDFMPTQSNSFHHSGLGDVKQAVQQLVNQACPIEKIVLGIPVYARHQMNPSQVKTFADIVTESGSSSNSDVLSEVASFQGFSYDSPSQVTDKVQYAVREGLGGIFFWELGQDFVDEKNDGGILVTAAYEQATDPTMYEEL